MKTPILHSSLVLTLNKLWQPLGFRTVREAFLRMTDQNAEAPARPVSVVLDHDGSLSSHTQVLTWKEWAKLPVGADDISIGMTGGRRVLVPHVIIVPSFGQLPKVRLQFSRRGLYIRERGKCAYCAEHVNFDESTIDHVIPQAANGPTNWENCVLSCKPCNFGKADIPLWKTGMKLTKRPVKPPALPPLCDFKGDNVHHKPFLIAA